MESYIAIMCEANMSKWKQVLTDPIQRAVYDEIHGYAATATNPFLDDSTPRDHVFVDEFSCIGSDDFALNRNCIWIQFNELLIMFYSHLSAGCKNCANVCSKVFQIEEDFGRARVYDQSGSAELIQEAIDSWWEWKNLYFFFALTFIR